MSADDFRDLVQEFDHSSVTNITFHRWSSPDFEMGDPVPGTGGYAAFVVPKPWAYIADAPQIYRDQLPEGVRQRESVLVWQWTEDLDGTPRDVFRTVSQAAHGKADRLYDVDRDRWYEAQKQGDFARIAKVNSAIWTLIDGDPL